MNKEQQIKEITEIITRLQGCGRKGISPTEAVIVYNKDIATALYEAGYRKQEDVVKEFAEKINVEANKPNIGETEEEWDNNEAFKDGLRHAIELSEQYGKEEKWKKR